MVEHSLKVCKAIRQFERAVMRKSEEGCIPLWSDDPEEQVLIDNARLAIKRQYSRAYNNLAKMLTTNTKGNEDVK